MKYYFLFTWIHIGGAFTTCRSCRRLRKRFHMENRFAAFGSSYRISYEASDSGSSDTPLSLPRAARELLRELEIPRRICRSCRRLRRRCPMENRFAAFGSSYRDQWRYFLLLISTNRLSMNRRLRYMPLSGQT